jgi:hypothetical protein
MSLFARFLVVILLGCGLWFLAARIPPEHLPWTPLDLAAEIGFFTKAKTAALKDDAPACHAALTAAEIGFRPLAESGTATCPLENMVSLQKSHYPYSSAVRANCALAAAISIWEKQVVAEAAARHLSSPVARIDHAGIFSCRNVRGSTTRRSHHATASAIDITGFTLADGRRITVLKDWGRDTPGGRFLADVHRGGCRVFRGALGPDYNALHRDHFHFDLGGFSICR